MGKDRNPEIFLKALKKITEENEEFKSKLKIVFAGPVEETVRNEIKKNNLEQYYNELGNISRADALQLNKNSKILLLPINKADNAEGRLPGKVYEYLRIGNPILCLGPVISDIAKIISETNTGKTFTYDNNKEIKSYIIDVFEEKTDLEPVNIEQFSNENQTKLIAKYLDEITNKKN
jgi:hypothetical protein